jgi:hypothetical protein
MYVQFIKDEKGNCIVEYARNEYEATEGMTHMYDWEIDGYIPDLLEQDKLYALERNGEMVDGCLGFKSVAQHVGDNKIFTILRKEGEYHDEENNIHLRIVHPVAVRDIAADEESETDDDYWGDADSGNLDFLVGKKEEDEGWEGTCKVIGIEPERSLREAIIRCMVDNGYVESSDKVIAVDDWHYQVTGEMRLWEKKEDLLSKKIDEALKQAGWNVTVNVQLAAKDDASFIIDITNHSFGAYYAFLQYDSDFGFERDVQVSRDPDEFYLQVIRNIFLNVENVDARIEEIESLLKSGFCEADDDCVQEFRPRLLLRDGDIVAENIVDVFTYDRLIEYIDLPDFDEEEDPQEAHDEFMENLEAEGKNLYCLNVK